MSIVEVYREPAGSEPPRRTYERVLAGAGAHRAVVLQLRAEALAGAVLRAALHRRDVEGSGDAAAAWLRSTFRRDDEALRQAAVAALALGLDRRATRRFPASFAELYPAAHRRLADGLRREGRYAEGAFSRDVALVSALAAPTGALNLHAPERAGTAGLPLRLRRTAGAFARQVLQFGPEEARAWLRAAGAKAWAEVHLDVRGLHDFNADGFRRSYHLAADLLRTRRDLAGLYGASWLYDPRVAAISPGLAFVRRTAEDGGGRIVRLKVDPVQTAFAVARSPLRRALVEGGSYRPACYALYWPASELIAWSDRARAEAAGRNRLQVVRK